jgi:hypothetical protein
MLVTFILVVRVVSTNEYSWSEARLVSECMRSLFNVDRVEGPEGKDS